MVEAVKLGAYGAVNQETLTADLKSLEVEPVKRGRYWNTAAAVGSYLPTYTEWLAKRPQEIGSNVQQLLRDGETDLRIFALDEGLVRRREVVGRFSGFTRARDVRGSDPIHGAEVTSVNGVMVNWGIRLPLLRLMEYGHPDPSQEFVISLSDLAERVQSGQAEIELS